MIKKSFCRVKICVCRDFFVTLWPNFYCMVILFENINKGEWLQTITDGIRNSAVVDVTEKIELNFSMDVKKDLLKPFHIVTYACLIQYLIDKGFVVLQGQTNKEAAAYIYSDLGLCKYWKGSNHEEVSGDEILNLWRIIESEKDLFSKRVENYFRNTYFRDKDTSAISLSLVEAFYNVFDHADAGNNAFSQVMYDADKKLLHVAVSDFGKEIVGTVRAFDSSIKTDTEALERAIRDDFTISSTTHNKGKGLDIILSCAETARIFSGNALLVKTTGGKRFIETSFAYPGTLIYYDIDLSQLEDLEIIDEFNL